MKSLLLMTVLIPALCLGGTDLQFNAGQSTRVAVTQVNELKTSVEFELSGLTTETVNIEGKNYTRILPSQQELLDFGFTEQEGLPNLPVYGSCMIIPDQAGVRVNIISSQYEIYENIEVMPAQPWALESGPQELNFVQNGAFYRQDEFYPGDLVELSEPMIMRDFRFVRAAINPVQYNPATKEMRVYTSIDYELVYEGTDNRNVKIRRDNRISEAFLPIYRNLFDNADEILTDFEPVKGGYLILTPNNLNFADTIQVLARWKHLKGYYTTVVPSNVINPSGTPTYLQIYTYIHDAYTDWEVPPDYLLIVGDEDQRIPDYPYGGYASDHQYTTVDGTDYMPDIFVARMAVDNMNELRVAMRKVLGYEQNPDMTQPAFWKRGIGVAGNIGATTPRITNLWVRDLALEHGYTHVDTVFDWGSGAPNWSTISTAINNGISYLSYRGWAGASGWYNPNWGVSNVGALTNGWKMGIMASIVCGTGNFSYDVCLGEAWIRYGSPTAPKGGPCFYGSTDGGTHTAWNNPNMTGFFWALFEQDMNHFSQLMVMGKLGVFQAFPSFTQPGDYVNQYFNTYNSLGDPELEVRTEIPRALTATYPATIPVGTNHLAVSVTADGLPLEGAYVNLVKGHDADEEVFKGGLTDASGNIHFAISNTRADTIFVTVTARDFIPHIGFCRSLAQPIALGVDSTAVDDDDIDNTSGNNDGLVNPGERLGLNIRLRNFGDSQTGTGITATLSSPDPRITVPVATQSYPDIAPGNQAMPAGQFIVELGQDIPHGDHILLNLAITADEGGFTGVSDLEINSIKPTTLTLSYPGNPNNRLDPGETSDIVVSFFNAGGLNGRQITGQLSCADGYVTILDGSGSFGDIDIGQTGDNSGNPFRIAVDENAYNGRNINFAISFTADMPDMNDVMFERTFSTVLGSVNSFDPVGPDNYGYYMYDNTDLSYSPAPFYDWVEINPNLGGQGTRLNPPSSDDASVLIALPFNCRYYGQQYGHMIVCTNGYVAFDTIPYDQAGQYWFNWENWPIPDPGNAHAQISPFWDDLKYVGSTNGLYTYHDVANGRFIVEWSGMTHARTGSPQTIELIIYDSDVHPTPTGDCEIVFQYAVVNNDDYNDSYTHPESYSSVGFEDWGQHDGLQYEYDNIYHPGAAELQSGLAIKITTATGLAEQPDMSYTPDSFSLQCPEGDYAEANLIFRNDGEGYLFYSISPEIINREGTNRGNSPIESAPVNEKNVPPIAPSPASQAPKSDLINGPVNPPVILDEGGPDDYGYTWKDSNEPDGPAYNWIDISAIGTPINWSGDTDDGTVTGIPIGFQFPFYGNFYTTINACTNGFMSFTSSSSDYNNVGMPNTSDPNNLLAPYWDDLNFETGGQAYYYSNGIDSFIIAYVGVPHWQAEGRFTFEVILQSSGKITYQYQEASGIDINQETIGIENSSGTDGLQVCYNAAYVVPGLAVRFTAGWWLSVNPASHIVPPHSSDTAIVRGDASLLESGDYEGLLLVETNDSDYPSLNLPVHFHVFPLSACEYLPGDVNGDGSVTASDVTYGARFFEGVGPVPADSCWNDSSNIWLYAAADANGNCEVLGSDISYLVSFFRGINPDPGWCPQTPPLATLRHPSAKRALPGNHAGDK